VTTSENCMMGDVSALDASTERTGDSIKSVTLLLPVWGDRFISRFLEFCLPTLLAPNNVPALARELPCRFVLLSRESDEQLILSHPLWQRLKKFCDAEIELVDDLITGGNHTATITLAFERGLRGTAGAIRDSCFVFLMSDYIVADGSLKSVLEAIKNGASAVLVGNFQVTAEDAVPVLRAGLDPSSPEVVLQPRDLMRWSLGHLHPATVANIANFGLTHNAHTNRLFWRVDESTLIGRFYLMHPIAIRPEVNDFTVAASWDYSFVPELCPSGRVVTLTDSDDYLVVEMQPRGYEKSNLRPGPIGVAELAGSLAEWTTARHRANIEDTLVFHAADVPTATQQTIAQADTFLNQVGALLTTPPMPHRHHPYWIGSIAVNRRDAGRFLNREDCVFLCRDETPANDFVAALLRARTAVIGAAPAVTRWHPRWPDYEGALTALQTTLHSNGRALIVSDAPFMFQEWLSRESGDAWIIGADQLIELPSINYAPHVQTFDSCLLAVSESSVVRCDHLIGRIRPLLKDDGRIDIVILNGRRPSAAALFSRHFIDEAARIFQQDASVVDVQYVRCGRLAGWIRRKGNRWLGEHQRRSPKPSAFRAAAMFPTALATFLANLTTSRKDTAPTDMWSSVCVTLRAAKRASNGAPRSGNDNVSRHADSAGAPIAVERGVAEASRVDQQRDQLPVREGDAPQSAAVMAGFRLVAKLLAERHDVAEFGFASAWGTRMVSRKVKQLRLFDPRERIVFEQQKQLAGEATFKAAELHDILSGPFHRKVDSIYSIDFIQYISSDDEDAFVRNLRDSLSPIGLLLVGSPTYYSSARNGSGPSLGPNSKGKNTSEPTASERAPMGLSSRAPAPGRARHSLSGIETGEPKVYYRTTEELVVVLQRHFQAVFTFSLIDDIAIPGRYPGAQHVFALGCGKKD